MGSTRQTDDTENVFIELDSSSRSGRYAEDAERLSVSSRQSIRDQMQADIEAFLARGGQIELLDTSMSAEKLRPH